MNHLEYAILKAKPPIKKARRRARNSKLYKELPEEKERRYKIDTENLDHETMRQLASEWFNSWNDSSFIRRITKGFMSRKTEIDRDLYLNNEYHWLKKHIPDIESMIELPFFVLQFKYIIPNFFISWLEEEEISKRKRITGEIETAILDCLNTGVSAVNIKNIYAKIENFESVINGVITSMENKGYIEKNGRWFNLKNGKKLHDIYLNKTDKVAKDNQGWYIK